VKVVDPQRHVQEWQSNVSYAKGSIVVVSKTIVTVDETTKALTRLLISPAYKPKKPRPDSYVQKTYFTAVGEVDNRSSPTDHLNPLLHRLFSEPARSLSWL
jgi:hypothetical protein